MCKSNQVKCKGELNLAGTIIPCCVLEDGTRVLSGRKMQEALKIADGGCEIASGRKLNEFTGSKSLKPFITNQLGAVGISPIIWYEDGKRKSGYRADLLADICDAMLEARKSIKLTSRQRIVADQCEILMRSFARVGITALVDEATGYQAMRESTELQKILAAYVSDEVAKWQLTFSNDFYQEMFRLWGLDYDSTKSTKPIVVGMLTNLYVYKALPEGVLEALKEKTGKTEGGNWKHKLHQSLTPEVGRQHLKNQIVGVTALMAASKSKDQFKELFNNAYHREEEIREVI